MKLGYVLKIIKLWQVFVYIIACIHPYLPTSLPTHPFNLNHIREYIIKVNTYPWLNKNYQIFMQVPTTLFMFLNNVL